MPVELKRVGVVSVAKIYGIIMAIIGLFVGILIALFGTGAAAIAGMPGVVAISAGILSIILFPILYGIIGFLMGAIGAILYNFVADKVGGVELTFKEKRK